MTLAISQARDDLHTCSKHSLYLQEDLKSNPAILVFQSAVEAAENPQIPVPTLFEFGHPTLPLWRRNPSLPTVAECAVHLELLQVFYSLRVRILGSTELDDLLEIKANPRTVYRTTALDGRRTTRTAVQVRDETFDERRKVKWPFYLNLAASRFLRWVDAMEDGADFVQRSFRIPPIDVLMVWHALLLNPSWFQNFEYRKLEKLTRLAFPWQAIHNSITSTDADWPFNLSPDDKFSFEGKTHMYSDLLHALENSQKSQKLAHILRIYHTKVSSSDPGAEIQPDSTGLNRLEYDFFRCFIEVGNPTILNLVSAVQRQSSFVAKMNNQLWIRSPAIEGTLIRAVTRYGNFLKLFGLYPRTMLVPTLDIDLLWHTHQCSPVQYMAATKALTGRFIDHDDKIGSETLETAMQKTADLYQIRFGEEYQYCCCWDCEALRSIILAQDPNSNKDAFEIAQQVHEDLAYYRAVEIARRNKNTLLPIRARSNK